MKLGANCTFTWHAAQALRCRGYCRLLGRHKPADVGAPALTHLALATLIISPVIGVVNATNDVVETGLNQPRRPQPQFVGECGKRTPEVVQRPMRDWLQATLARLR
jgi:hypothetical protein